MGRKKGDSFITQPPFEIILALVLTFLILGFIIVQSGGLSSIMKSVCEKVPELCKGSVSSVDYETAKQSTQMLTCGTSTARSASPQCMDVKIGKIITGQAVAAPGGGASITCDIKNGYPELEYEEGCWAACHHENVWYVFDSGEWKWKCPDCEKNNYNSISAMGMILSEVDAVHKEIQTNLLQLRNINGEEQRYKIGLQHLQNAILSNSYEKDDSIIIHHKNGKTEVFGRGESNKIIEIGSEKSSVCKVSNFNLPETFAGFAGGAKEFIPVAGDPSFLVYYQRFPVGEDADWSDMAPWFRDVGKVMFLGMCVLDVYTGVRAGATVVKGAAARGGAAVTGFAKETGTKIIGAVERTMEKIPGIRRLVTVDAEAAAAQAERLAAAELQAVAPGLAGKVEGGAILQFLKRDSLNSGIIRYLKGKYPGKTAEEVFAQEAQHLLDGTPTGRLNYESLSQQFKKAWDNNPIGVDLTAMLANKEDPNLVAKLVGKVSPDTLARFIKYVGVDSIASYYLAEIDSNIGKFIKLNSNSIVLGMPARNEEPFKLSEENIIPKPQNIVYPEKQNLVPLGKPVVLMKDGWGNVPTPFYLASPCKADLIIETKSIYCGAYVYDSLSGEASCITPTKDEDSDWYDRLFSSGQIPRKCGSLVAGEKGSFNQEYFNRFKTTSANIAQNLESARVYGGEVTINEAKRIKITDPIEGIEFYYDKDAQVIDFIGATIKQGDNFRYDTWNVKSFFDVAREKGETIYWPLNNKDDGRSFYFDPAWNIRAENLPLIKPTSKGAMGFACEKRKINKDETEQFMTGMTGDEELDAKGNDYLVCNVEGILDRVGGILPKTNWRIYFDGTTGNFYGIYVTKGMFDNFVLLDSNYDGTIDRFGQFYRHFRYGATAAGDIKMDEKVTTNFQYSVFYDKDFNHAVDGVASSDCSIPGAVTITVSNATKDENGNSYCYKSKSGAWGVASTVALFGASAASKFGGGWGMAAGIVVDCGIAAIEVWNPGGIVKTNWPSGGYFGSSRYTP
jgi:hypothetical protein